MGHLINNNWVQTTQSWCGDLSKPSFDGVQSVVADGMRLIVSWDPANLECSYQVYLSTSPSVFSPDNLILSTPNLSASIFTTAEGNALQPGRTYYVGVRATTTMGSADANLISLPCSITNALSNLNLNVAKTLGLAQHNYFVDETVYDGNSLVSARYRIYYSSQDVGTDNGVIASYRMSSSHAGALLEEYQVDEELSSSSSSTVQ